MLGAHNSGIVRAASADVRPLRLFQPGGGQHQRNLARLASRRGPRRSPRAWKNRSSRRPLSASVLDERHADRPDAGHLPASSPKLRMAGGFERGGDFQFRIGVAQRDQPLPHAAGGSVDGDANRFHDGSGILCRSLRRSDRVRRAISCTAGWL